MAYNQSIIKANNSTLTFDVVSNNEPLFFSADIKKVESMQSIFYLLSCIALGLLGLSLVHKMIGAELMFSCQIVFLSICFNSKSSVIMSAVKSFKWVSGSWPIFTNNFDKSLLSPFSDRTELTK